MSTVTFTRVVRWILVASFCQHLVLSALPLLLKSEEKPNTPLTSANPCYRLFPVMELLDYIKNQLETNPAWAARAILKLYECQTMDEQVTGQTANINGVGFNGLDSVILSSFAEQLLKGRTLTAKQLAIAHKKLPKYGRQVMGFIPEEKLEQIKVKIGA